MQMKKIDQTILDRAVASHFNKLNIANTITKLTGMAGVATFMTLAMLAEPGASIIQAYAVGVVFSALLVGFSLVVAGTTVTYKPLSQSDNVPRY